jgi:hypothetical protein
VQGLERFQIRWNRKPLRIPLFDAPSAANRFPLRREAL